MRPVPDEGNDSIASGSSPRTRPRRTKLSIRLTPNKTGAKPRPSLVASATGGTPRIKSSRNSGLALSPESSTSSLLGSSNATPTTVVADTPNTVPGPTLSRPKTLLVRSPTVSTTVPTRWRPPSVSPARSEDFTTPSASGSSSSSCSDVAESNPPPVPPTPTPEQLAALDAKRPAWTKEEDQYIIDYMNWVFARDPLASTTEIMRKIAANVPESNPDGSTSGIMWGVEAELRREERDAQFAFLRARGSGQAGRRNE
ncbi:hypothetical protein RSOLAG1IB_05391 [Rhizoctonia solani AG-1 IB]|uniref:Uncharacterized protein n=1 Tax=Thanatephorus cucumeris (strain AG1-IB / isolate 7/3/14) TaxID=1108050 RepID=A0A0B7G4G1_THACB|nr:hypothetical protein RSOLAG1IB_05391 [Rhizoctonia solani AG-1 IB]